MKKIFAITLILLLALALCVVTVACERTYDEPLQPMGGLCNVTYTAGDGGYIFGETKQVVNRSENAAEVTAKPFPGYRFVKWSDDYLIEKGNPVRKDEGVLGDINVTAEFEKATFSVRYTEKSQANYLPDGKGYILGNDWQTIDYGRDATEVTAMPFAGYTFVEWSDAVQTPNRQDRDIVEDLSVTAIFVRTNQKLIYEYDGATGDDNAKYIYLSWNGTSDVNYAVPKKNGHKFLGWFLEPELINKVANMAGQPLMGNEILVKNTGKLYAKWVNEDTLVYPVLMVYATEINARIHDTPETYITVEYTLSYYEKKICALLTPRFAKTLNELLDGKVLFEVDEYYTTEVITETNVQGTFAFYGNDGYPRYLYNAHAYNILEVCDMIKNYRSVITTFGMRDFDDLLHSGGGIGSAGYAVSYFETFIGTEAYNSAETYEKYLNSPEIMFENVMSHYVHEFTHTVEGNYFEKPSDIGAVYDYHIFGAYYSRLGLTELEYAKLYLLKEGFIDGKQEGVPFSYWESNDFDFNVTYIAEFVIDPNVANIGGILTILSDTDGKEIEIYNDNTYIKQNLTYGDDAVKIMAVPTEGYKFVMWSDGDINPTRQDKGNIITRFIRAYFEKIG